MAEKLVSWCVRSADDRVIDPSFGGSVFLRLAKERLLELGAAPDRVRSQIYGVDLDERALRKGRGDDGPGEVSLIHSDFFLVEPECLPRFTANLGNPPYIRYQSWDADASRAHSISKKSGVNLSRLSSIWAPFIVHGCRFLERGGRLGQVLPAELLHAQYARPLLNHLIQSFHQVTLVFFQERVFPGALEEILLLFADGYGEGPAQGIGVVECRNLEDLHLARVDGRGNGYLVPDIALLRLLPEPVQTLYQGLSLHERVSRLGGLAEVDIGAVTGANAFFIRAQSEIEKRRFAPELFQTIVGRAADAAGARLSNDDIRSLVQRGRRTELFVANGNATEAQMATVTALIREGELLGVPSRYKCRVRSPWWSVPLPKRGAPDAFLTYMNDAHPRLVSNEARAISTNTIHNVSVREDVSPAALTVAFYNSLTLLSAELVGRSYGGGMLKLEPTEAERILVPQFEPTINRHLPEVDRLLRAGETQRVLDLVDPIVLTPIGLRDSDIAHLRSARLKLLTRRRARSKNNG